MCVCVCVCVCVCTYIIEALCRIPETNTTFNLKINKYDDGKKKKKYEAQRS